MSAGVEAIKLISECALEYRSEAFVLGKCFGPRRRCVLLFTDTWGVGSHSDSPAHKVSDRMV